MKIHEVLTTILLIVVVSLSLLISYRLINIESTVTLLFFNIFFVSLIFQLKTILAKKALVLVIGNLLGVFCNLLFFNFHNASLNFFDNNTLKAFYVLFFPFLNLIWIVLFWSFGLSFLTENKNSL